MPTSILRASGKNTRIPLSIFLVFGGIRRQMGLRFSDLNF